MLVILAVAIFLVIFTSFLLYIVWNDRKLTNLPDRAASFSPNRVSPSDVRATARKLAREPPASIRGQIPPKTGRRYIVVGGGGFLGGWIVSQLLERGEDPTKIRILDLHSSSRKDFAAGPASRIAFFKVDISDREAVQAAFNAPWPGEGNSKPELTVFHTAASIRFYERHPDLVQRSAQANVQGTQNVVDAARAVGVNVMVYTSSGSTCVRRSRFWLWPWEREPPFFVQVINDLDDAIFPTRHDQFFSNYAFTKRQAEEIVRAADKSSSANHESGILRTGCLRPGNGIFGPGDMLCHSYLRRTSNPTWVSNILQSFIYVENCACAHLCYEQRLVDLAQSSPKNPDIGGQVFTIADPGPPVTFGDIYTTLETLTDGETHFTRLSATAMLLVSHLIELYYVTREVVGAKFSVIQKMMPPILGDIVSLQPSLFPLTQVHLIFDDSRARLPPEEGGLGYRGVWTTIQGVHKTYDEHKKGFDNKHNSGSGGVTLSFRLFKKKVKNSHLVAEPPLKAPVQVAIVN
ncbi:hypothetical protein AX15_007945 [Amanita polypyramis BW_CC]|nr:hypothetical protein AX15_007945 [Amanita polypyramis BW_CC]